MKKIIFLALLLVANSAFLKAQDNVNKYSWKRVAYSMPENWYSTDKAIEIADNVIKCQTNNGGWIKNLPYHNLKDFSEIEQARKTGIGATIDNGSTTMEMNYLARVYNATKIEKYRDAFIKAFNFIIEAQYKNGGWPQFYPPRPNVPYSACITYNDDAYLNVMNLLKQVYTNDKRFTGLNLGNDIKQKAKDSYKHGIDCILATQIRVNGKPTVWCAQHDQVTLAPAKARAYELPSFSGAESVGLVSLLMSEEKPSKEIIESVKGAVKWFEEHKIKDTKYVSCRDKVNGPFAHLEAEKGHDIWGRFYDLDTEKVYVSDRDGIKKSSLEEIGNERRNGYSWYTDAPQKIINEYPKWLKRNNL